MSQPLAHSPNEVDHALEEMLLHVPEYLSMGDYAVESSFATTTSCLLRTDTFRSHITFNNLHQSSHAIQESLASLLCKWIHVVRLRSGTHYEPCSASLTIDLPQLDCSLLCNFSSLQPSSIHSRLKELRISTPSALSCCDAVIRADVTSMEDGATEEYLEKQYGGCPLRVVYE